MAQLSDIRIMNEQSNITNLDFHPPLRTYSTGDTIICQVQAKTDGGFIVGLPNKDIRSAFLPTNLDFSIGLPVEVFYVDHLDGKLLFSLTDDEFRKHARQKVKAYSYPQYSCWTKNNLTFRK